MKMRLRAIYVVMTLIGASSTALGQNVKVTPIGQRTGEFCAQDRAILFEDPTGVRLLYDPGNTIAGETVRDLARFTLFSSRTRTLTT